MTKTEQIRKLLEENKDTLLQGEKNNGICFDGIVDELQYKNVVVLLKETNGTDATGKLPEKLDDWDYCRWIKEQQVENKPEKKIDKNGKEYIEENVFYHSTFRKLCYWLSLLFDTLNNEKADAEKFMKNGQVDIPQVRKVLNNVAVVNIKKSWGNKQTNGSELTKYASNPEIKDILREQMDILNPKIVLCCSPEVYRLAQQIYSEGINFEHCEQSKAIQGKDIEWSLINDTVYVSFYHPQYYGKTDAEFSNYALETFTTVKSYMKANKLL